MKEKTKVGYLGIDQYGVHYNLTKYPRKELKKSPYWLPGNISTMYCDNKKGEKVKKGYVVGGLWIEIFEVHSWNK
tara:strand:+ start:1674 stop:1898 length:225 start_codon:yes stop_codon:yes gene_type:complete